MNPVIIIIIGYPTEIKVKVRLDFSQVGGTVSKCTGYHIAMPEWDFHKV